MTLWKISCSVPVVAGACVEIVPVPATVKTCEPNARRVKVVQRNARNLYRASNLFHDVYKNPKGPDDMSTARFHHAEQDFESALAVKPPGADKVNEQSLMEWSKELEKASRKAITIYEVSFAKATEHGPFKAAAAARGGQLYDHMAYSWAAAAVPKTLVKDTDIRIYCDRLRDVVLPVRKKADDAWKKCAEIAKGNGDWGKLCAERMAEPADKIRPAF